MSELTPVQLFYICLTVAIILTRIPVLGVFFRSVNTLLHETGHALAALLLSGEVLSVSLNSDTSGSAHTRMTSKRGALLVSFAGYPFAAAGSTTLVWMAVTGHIRIGLFALLSLALSNLVLFVRNAYGITWLIIFSGIVVFLLKSDLQETNRTFFLVVSLIAFAETVISTLIIIWQGLMHPSKAGDITILAKQSRINASIWTILMALVCGYIIFETVARFFPPFSQLLTNPAV